jgi:hypothetical protein
MHSTAHAPGLTAIRLRCCLSDRPTGRSKYVPVPVRLSETLIREWFNQRITRHREKPLQDKTQRHATSGFPNGFLLQAALRITRSERLRLQLRQSVKQHSIGGVGAVLRSEAKFVQCSSVGPAWITRGPSSCSTQSGLRDIQVLA